MRVRTSALAAIVFLFLVCTAAVLAAQPTIIALQGKLVNTTTGAIIYSTSLRVNVSDINGVTLWNQTYSNAVSSGFFDILLGSSAENPLNLTYDQDYNISVYVGNSPVQIGGSYRFRSGKGQISPSNLSSGNFSSPGNFSFGTSLFIDKTNDRIGVGTTAPTKKMEISDTIWGVTVDPSAFMPTINTTSPGGISKNLTIASEDGSIIVQLG